MNQEIVQTHILDADGNPTGGETTGTGITIYWQNGPLGRGADRKEPNGAFVEGVIQAALGRLEFFQANKFSCSENARAIEHLNRALLALNERTSRREKAGTEGTHAGDQK